MLTTPSDIFVFKRYHVGWLDILNIAIIYAVVVLTLTTYRLFVLATWKCRLNGHKPIKTMMVEMSHVTGKVLQHSVRCQLTLR